jgi:hypothetical protein
MTMTTKIAIPTSNPPPEPRRMSGTHVENLRVVASLLKEEARYGMATQVLEAADRLEALTSRCRPTMDDARAISAATGAQHWADPPPGHKRVRVAVVVSDRNAKYAEAIWDDQEDADVIQYLEELIDDAVCVAKCILVVDVPPIPPIPEVPAVVERGVSAPTPKGS